MSRKLWWMRIGVRLMKKGRLVNSLDKWCANSLTGFAHPTLAYEHKHFPISAADPIEAIKFRMEQQGLTQKDLEPFIGSSGRVSEVLNHKRGLSLPMVKRLHEVLNIPYESLLSAA